MSSFNAWFPAAAAQWLPFLADSALKGLLLLALATLVAGLLLRRRPAAARHMLLSMTAVGLLGIPLLSATLPALHIPILPAPLLVVTPEGVSSTSSNPAAMPSRAHYKQPEPPLVVTPEGVSSASSSSGDHALPGTLRATSPWSPSAWVVAVWSAVTLLLLAHLLLGSLLAALRCARAARVLDPEWLALIQDLSRQLGLRRPVRLLLDPRGLIPAASGLLRPAILLPPAALDWTDQRRRIVALHELAHVKRRDCLTQFLCRLAWSLHWFNPLVWLAARMIRLDREHACDDLVLSAALLPPIKPSDYATHLLDIVASLRCPAFPSPTTVSMARCSHLKTRLLAILDPRRHRLPLPRRAVLLAALLLLAVTIPLSLLRATAHERRQAGTATQPAPSSQRAAIVPTETAWGQAADGLQAGLSATSVQMQPEPRIAVLLSVRNVGAKPVRMRRLSELAGLWGRRLPVAVESQGKAAAYVGPAPGPAAPADYNSHTPLDPGRTESVEAVMRLSDWGLKDPRGLRLTFRFANDKESERFLYNDRAGEWKQAQGLWVGQARSGGVTLDEPVLRRTLADDLLPDEGTPLKLAVTRRFDYIAVMEALDEARLNTPADPADGYTQTFRQIEILQAPWIRQEPKTVTLHIAQPQGRQRRVVPGERLLWIVRRADFRPNDHAPRPGTGKAIPDTPANRKALADCVAPGAPAEVRDALWRSYLCDTGSRSWAVSALGPLAAGGSKEAIARLVELLGDYEVHSGVAPGERPYFEAIGIRVSDAVQKIGPPAAPALLAALQDVGNPSRAACAGGILQSWRQASKPPRPIAPAELAARTRLLRALGQRITVTTPHPSGAPDKSYTLVLTCEPPGPPVQGPLDARPHPPVIPGDRVLTLDPRQISRAVEGLLADGFLTRSVIEPDPPLPYDWDIWSWDIPWSPSSPGGSIAVSGAGLMERERLAGGAAALARLEALRKALDGPAAAAVGSLLSNLQNLPATAWAPPDPAAAWAASRPAAANPPAEGAKSSVGGAGETLVLKYRERTRRMVVNPQTGGFEVKEPTGPLTRLQARVVRVSHSSFDSPSFNHDNNSILFELLPGNTVPGRPGVKEVRLRHGNRAETPALANYRAGSAAVLVFSADGLLVDVEDPSPAAASRPASGPAAPAKPSPAATQPATRPGEAPWGPVVNGLRARLTAGRTKFTVGESIPVRLEIQCVKGYPEGRKGCQLFPHVSFSLSPLVIWGERLNVEERKSVKLKIANRLHIVEGETFSQQFDLREIFPLNKPDDYLVIAEHQNGDVKDVGDWTGDVRSALLVIEIAKASEAATPGATMQPATGPAMVDGPWAEAKIGMVVRMVGDLEQTRTEVVSVGPDSVTCLVTPSAIWRGAVRTRPEDIKPVPKTSPRRMTPGQVAQWELALGRRVADEAITIGGRRLSCQVYEMTQPGDHGPSEVEKVWVHKGTPGWIVMKTWDNAPGKVPGDGLRHRCSSQIQVDFPPPAPTTRPAAAGPGSPDPASALAKPSPAATGAASRPREPWERPLTPEQRADRVRQVLDPGSDDKTRYEALCALSLGGYSRESAEAMGAVAADAKARPLDRWEASMGLRILTQDMPEAVREPIRQKLRQAVKAEQEKLPVGPLYAMILWGEADWIAETMGKNLRGRQEEVEILGRVRSREDAIARLWELYRTAPPMGTDEGLIKRRHIGMVLAERGDERGKAIVQECRTAEAVAEAKTKGHASWPVVYRGATDLLYQGGPRGRAAAMLRDMKGVEPAYSQEERSAKELAGLLEAMAKEDAAHVEPANPAALPMEQRVRYLAYKVRDVAARQRWVPGECVVLRDSNLPESAAHQLRRIGKPAVPVLIDMLTDTRPTRSLAGGRVLAPHVLRHCDVALQVLEAIARRRFRASPPDPYLLSEAQRSEAVAAAKAWWQEHKDSSELDWIRRSLPTEGMDGVYEGTMQAIALEGAAAALKDPCVEIRMKTAWILGEKRAKVPTEALAEALKDADPRVRALAAEALGKLCDEQALPALRAAAGDKDADARDKALTGVRKIEIAAGMVQVAPADKGWGEPVKGMAARVSPVEKAFDLGKPALVQFELMKVKGDAETPKEARLGNLIVDGVGPYNGPEAGKVLQLAPRPEAGWIFWMPRVDLRDFGGGPAINADNPIRVGLPVGYDGQKQLVVWSRPINHRVHLSSGKALDAYVLDCLERARVSEKDRVHPAERWMLWIARIPADQLQDNPETYLQPREGPDVGVYSQQDAGYLYGRRVAQRQIAAGRRQGYVPRPDWKGIPFIQGFQQGYADTLAEAQGLPIPSTQPAAPAKGSPTAGPPATPPPDKAEARDKLLADADQRLRQGLKVLASTFPQLAVANNKPLEEALKDCPLAAGRINIWVGRGKLEGKVPWRAEKIADTDAWQLWVSVQPNLPPANPQTAQPIASSLAYPALNLRELRRASAGDPKLEAALNKLANEALAPLATLERAQVPWGQAANGCRVRLRARETAWVVGQRPVFELDLENVGTEDIKYGLHTILNTRPVVDGRRYGPAGDPAKVGKFTVHCLRPGEKRIPLIEVELTDGWRDAEGRALDLAVGRHRVQAEFLLLGQVGRAGAMSNPVEFEVKPPPAPPAAGRPAGRAPEASLPRESAAAAADRALLEQLAGPLGQAVGGNWRITRQEKSDGPVLFAALSTWHNLGVCCVVLPAPMDEKGRARWDRLKRDFNMSFDVLGSNDRCTVLIQDHYDPDDALKIVKALGLAFRPEAEAARLASARAYWLDFRLAAAEAREGGPLPLADGPSAADVKSYRDLLAKSGPNGGRYRGDPFQWFHRIGACTPPGNLLTGAGTDSGYLLLSARPKDVLLSGSARPRQWHLKRVEATTDSQGRAGVAIEFDEASVKAMELLTTPNVGRPLAVLFDGNVMCVETIRAPISGGMLLSGGGQFTAELARKIARSLGECMLAEAEGAGSPAPAGRPGEALRFPKGASLETWLAGKEIVEIQWTRPGRELGFAGWLKSASGPTTVYQLNGGERDRPESTFVLVRMKVTPDTLKRVLSLQKDLAWRGYTLDTGATGAHSLEADPATRQKALEMLPSVQAAAEEGFRKALPGASIRSSARDSNHPPAGPDGYLGGVGCGVPETPVAASLYFRRMTVWNPYHDEMASLPALTVRLPRLGMIATLRCSGMPETSREYAAVGSAVRDALKPLIDLDGVARVGDGFHRPPLAGTLERVAGQADRILLIGWDTPGKSLKCLGALKGDRPESVTLVNRDPADLPIPPDKNGRWVIFLAETGKRDGVLSLEWPSGWWIGSGDAKYVEEVRKAIPGPADWRGNEGEGLKALQVGLRPRKGTLTLGGPIPIEVHLRNIGDKNAELPQLRYNIYDYYGSTTFLVTGPDGRQVVLAKPVGGIREADTPLRVTLAPVETYIHTARLDTWKPADPNAPAPFTRPDVYKIRCRIQLPGKQGVLESSPVPIDLVSAEPPAQPATPAATKPAGK